MATEEPRITWAEMVEKLENGEGFDRVAFTKKVKSHLELNLAGLDGAHVFAFWRLTEAMSTVYDHAPEALMEDAADYCKATWEMLHKEALVDGRSFDWCKTAQDFVNP